MESTDKREFSFSVDARSGTTRIFYAFAQQEDEETAGADDRRKPVSFIKKELLRVRKREDAVVIRPLFTLPGEHFLKPKYGQIETIVLVGFDFGCPKDSEEVEALLESLPSGFVKNPEYGLGFLREYRFIVETAERVSTVKHIELTRRRATSIDGETYVLNFSHYNEIRKAINKIHADALARARVDKAILAYNSLLHKLDGSKYPERQRPYTPDTIFKTIRDSSGRKFSENDQLTAVSLVARSGNELANRHPKTLLKLQREIELVTLAELIKKMESFISKNVSEVSWQEFFFDNPFVLTLAFGLPLVAIGDQISVGGRTFAGSGEKIADFVSKNRFTDNLALIEIKTPHTKLMGSEYRGGVYPPARELVGCVAQVLDQRHHLQVSLNQLKVTSKRYDVEAYAIRCVIIVGTTPSDPYQKKSLELFRNNLHDVLVITFDELIEKLVGLHGFLSADPTVLLSDAMPSV